jgi:hypothetical protein
VLLEVGERQPLQVGEEVVPHVVLEMPRGADQDPARPEAEQAADDADAEQGGAVGQQLGPGDPRCQVVDCRPQNEGRCQGDAGGDKGTDQTQGEGPAVTEDIP